LRVWRLQKYQVQFKCVDLDTASTLHNVPYGKAVTWLNVGPIDKTCSPIPYKNFM